MVALLYTGGATIFGGNDNKDWSKGYVTGSFESNTNWYSEDAKTSATAVILPFASTVATAASLVVQTISSPVEPTGIKVAVSVSV